MPELDLIGWLLIGAGALIGLYVAAWVASRAFFDNKISYNRKLLRRLEERE